MTLAAKVRGPGWYRAAVAIPLAFLFAMGLVTGVRALYGWDPVLDMSAVTTVALVAMPLSFLVGIGCLDYWLYWASGRPTRPEDHSGHGATSWRDYFRVNTDHKVIGIQYIVTTFFFFTIGGLLAMLIRAELAQPGTQFVDPNTYNGLFSVHALADDLPVHHPRLRGHRELRHPADDRGAGHGVPPAQRTVLLDAAHRRGADDRLLLRARGRVRDRVDRLRPALHPDAHRPAVLHPRGPVRGRLVHRHRAQLPGHDHHHARARHELLAHAAHGVGQLHHLAAGGDRHALHRRLAVLPAAGPLPGHALLRPEPRRRRADVPARLLVLLAPGGLHHDAAGLRDRVARSYRPTRASRCSATA